jgi:hypothetical protein
VSFRKVFDGIFCVLRIGANGCSPEGVRLGLDGPSQIPAVGERGIFERVWRNSSKGTTTSRESSGSGSRSTRTSSRRPSQGEDRSHPTDRGQTRDQRHITDQPERNTPLGLHGSQYPRHEGDFRYDRRDRHAETTAEAVSSTANMSACVMRLPQDRDGCHRQEICRTHQTPRRRSGRRGEMPPAEEMGHREERVMAQVIKEAPHQVGKEGEELSGPGPASLLHHHLQEDNSGISTKSD